MVLLSVAPIQDVCTYKTNQSDFDVNHSQTYCTECHRKIH